MFIYRYYIGVRKIIVIRMCMILILIVIVGVNVCGYMYFLDLFNEICLVYISCNILLILVVGFVGVWL